LRGFSGFFAFAVKKQARKAGGTNITVLCFQKNADNGRGASTVHTEEKMAKRIAAVLIIGAFFVLRAEAAMVSFLVIETGLMEEENKKQHSMQWENSLLDVFFDAGHIVCNAPMMRLDTKPVGEIRKVASADMAEAVEGGVDFFIIAQLDYTPGSQSPEAIALVVYTVTPAKKIYEKRMTGKSYRSVKDELEDLRGIVSGLIPHLKK
jgi:hypothetical protein